MVVESFLNGVRLLDAYMPLDAYFVHPGMLFLFIPLILLLLLLYTIRAYPKALQVPSLLFVLQNKKQRSPHRFLKRLPLNWILILHILLLSSFILAAAQPFVMVNRSQHADHVVIIIDASMSMQAADRFPEAIAEARKKISATNTIIAIYDTPKVLAENVNRLVADSILAQLEPADTRTALHASLQTAVDMRLDGAVIHVFTDGIPTVPSAVNMETLIARLEGRGNSVFIHEFRQGEHNVGIVHAHITDEQTTVHIKNFNHAYEDVEIELAGHRTSIQIPPREIATASFSTPPGHNTLQLQANNDDLAADDILYISGSSEQTFRILYLSNDPDRYLSLALSLMDFVDVDYQSPPGEVISDYDLYIVDQVDHALLLPSTMVEIERRVNNSGAGLIALVDQQNAQLNWQGLLPVHVEGHVIEDTVTVFPSRFTQDVAISGVQKILTAAPAPNAEILAGANEHVAFARRAHGNGVVYYYGLQRGSDFVHDFTYPLLFKAWIEDIVNTLGVEDKNVQIGTIIGNRASTILHPDGTTTTGSLTLRHTGFYEVDDIVYAANLHSDQESDIAFVAEESAGERFTALGTSDFPAPFYLWSYLIMFALGLLILEYALLRYRGEA